MPNDLMQYIGMRIKHYRKARGFTIREFADRIHKSKGSVSKYENGQISPDINTIFTMAEVLQIEPKHLLDYPLPRRTVMGSHRNPFHNQNVLYLYHMRGRTVYRSVVRLRPEAERITATLFYIVSDLSTPQNCNCIYEGEMHCHDTILCFTLQNLLNPVENLLLNFAIPARYFDTLTGLVSGLGAITLVPACFLGVLSPAPLAETDGLKQKLSISKAALAEAKKRNIFSWLPEETDL